MRLKVEDTGTDLAIIVAILSSNNNINARRLLFAAEVDCQEKLDQ